MEKMSWGFSPLFLQDEIVKTIRENLKDLYFLDPNGERVPLHVFAQNLPAEQDDEISRPFPYVIVRLNNGTAPRDPRGTEDIRVLVIVGVRNDDPQNIAHRDALGIMQRIKELFTRDNPPIKHYTIDDQIEWALDDNETFPYSFGGMDMTFKAQPIRREDPLT